MPDESAPPAQDPPSHFRNWLSLTGAVTAIGGLFAFVFLVAIDTFARETNPYVGILTYLVAPAFLILGLALGLVEGLTKVFYPEASSIVVFVIMAIVLMIRPAGLFGKEK